MANDVQSNIREFLESLSSYDASSMLKSRAASVLYRSKTTDKYRNIKSGSPQIGDSHVFVADASSVDLFYNHKQYLEDGRPSIADPFRASAGLYWTNKPAQHPKQKGSTENKLCYMNNSNPNARELHIPMKIHFSALEPVMEEGDGTSIEWLLVEANDKMLDIDFDAQKFSNTITNHVQNSGLLADNTLSVKRLKPRHELKDFSSHLTGHVDIHGDYNYWDGKYEAAIGNEIVKEPSIPNMYVFFAYHDSETQNPSFKKMLSLNGKIDLANHQDMIMGQISNKQVKASPSEKYFNTWVNNLGDALGDLTLMDLNRNYQNLLLSVEDMDKLASYNDKKELFPMWMHIEFTTDKMTEFAEAFKDSQLMGTLQQTLMKRASTGELATFQTLEAREVPAPTVTASEVISPEADPPARTVFENSARRFLPLDDWIESFMNSSPSDSANVLGDELFSTFLGTHDSTQTTSSDPKFKFFKSLMAVILKGKIKKLLKKHTRTIEEVLKGRPCYHEAVVYKVSKYAGAKAVGTPVQSIFIPNTNDLDIFKYMDTQVKYDKQYTYTVTSYELVVGNRYSYEEALTDVSWGKWAAVKVRNKASVILMEVPLYSHTNRVLDNPPIHPEVEFVPYKGINNKIKILMNSGIGRYTLDNEIIESVEEEQVQKVQKAQNKPKGSVKVTYETDDYPAFFEVWRLTEKPRSFADFSQQKVHHISTSLPRTNLISSGIAVDDKIKPNTKYYYCVRAIDNHGHISYPSPIYEVEMVDDKGSIYPLIGICEFAPEIESQPSLGGKRYLHLKPAMAQMVINEEASGLLDAVSVSQLERLTLGITEESLWDKKIKIRLTSKSTGRKMDFNITFKHKHMKLENRD